MTQAVCADQLSCAIDQRIDVGFLVSRGLIRRQSFEHRSRGSQQLSGYLERNIAGDRADVFTAVSVCGKRKVLTVQLEITQPHADGEDIHLPPRIVDVVLATDAKSDCVQYVGKCRTVSGLTPMPDMQRTGRVRRNKLDHDALTRSQSALAIAVAQLVDPRKLLCERLPAEKEVDEAGTSDLRSGNERIGRQGSDDRLRELARTAVRALGEPQGEARGEVAVTRIPRPLDAYRACLARREERARQPVHGRLK